MARTTLKDFLQRSRKAHGDKYDYSKVEYETTEKKVTIICKIHGEFEMRPRAHYKDLRGCPKCSNGKKSGFSYNSKWAKKPKWLYFIELYDGNERFLKIGVSKEEKLRRRFLKGQIPYEYDIIFKEISEKSSKFERLIKKEFSDFQYSPQNDFRGSNECFEMGIKGYMLNRIENLFNKK